MSTAFHDDRSFSMGHPAVLADILAVRDHAQTSAAEAHAALAKQIWSVLRALGVTGGRMLVRGLDPESLASALPVQRAPHPGRLGQLHGAIPRPGTQHRDLVLTEFDPGFTPGVFDIVLLNAPNSDVVHHDGRFRLERWREHNQDVLSSVAYTAPGGLVAAVVSADVLDAADAAPRRAMAVLADLLGAVRLPAGALRNVPGCDNPVDLLILRRRADDQPGRGARFETSVPLRLDGVPVRPNEYFHTRIGDVLGRPTLRLLPYGPARLTVEPDQVSRRLDLDLGLALAEIVHTALDRGLVCGTGTAGAARGSPADLGPHGIGPGGTGLRSPQPPDAGPGRPDPSL
ncbi:hypothetical protein [Promicromonospora sp. NPDC057488]|uniref:hypothetical protein n=1 Tax=Promicromonospora sp. NPDC057488 TaxID=3346147 RepID=UPI003670C09E